MILIPLSLDPNPTQNPDQMSILGISKLQEGDQDRFDAKYQDFPDPTVRADSAWIQGGCGNMQDTYSTVLLLGVCI